MCFDLLILDVMLPGKSGFDICHAARERGFDGGILMLTARGEIRDRVGGLRTGADDYLVKPFDPDELLARVSALLRRVHKEELTPVMRVEFGSIVADFSAMEFSRHGKPLSLTGKEGELLRMLVNHRGQTLSREKILQHVWREQPHITPRTVDVHVAWLRQEDRGKSRVTRAHPHHARRRLPLRKVTNWRRLLLSSSKPCRN